MLELWVALPIGFAVGLPAVVVGIIVAAGAVAGIVVAAFLGDKLRSFILRKRGDAIKPGGRLYEFFNKYGIVGYGILAPAFVGATVSSALGIALGIERRKVIIWVSVGAILWTIVGTVLCALGLFAIFGE